MPIRVMCPGCRKTLEGGDAYAGRQVKCPKCRTLVQFPASKSSDVPPKREPASERQPSTQSIPFKTEQSWLWGIQIVYDCPYCSAELKSSFQTAGTKDACRHCGRSFIVPGTSEKERIDKELAEALGTRSISSEHKAKVAAQVQSLDLASKLLGRRELKILHEVLWDDETILKIIQGLYNNGFGILVATNRRLVFVDKGMLWGLRVEDFPYDKITSIQYETGIVFGKVTIFASGNKAEIKQVDKSQARVFADSVRAYIAETGKRSTSQAAAPAPSDPLDQLERLARLREAGHITDQEYAAQKKRLLEST